MRDLLQTKHAWAGIAAAELTGAAWVALMHRFGHVALSPIPWWLPALAIVLIALGLSVAAIGKRNGDTPLRVAIVTLLGSGIAPFTAIPIIMVTVYPLGKLVESLGLINRASLPGELASNVVIAAMLAIWLLVGAGIGALLLRVTIGRSVSAELQAARRA